MVAADLRRSCLSSAIDGNRTTVAVLASSGELGGAERIALDLLIGLRESRPRWAVHLIVPADGAFGRRAREAGVPVTVVPWSAGVARLGDAMSPQAGWVRFLRRLFAAVPGAAADALRLRRVLKRLNPSLVHAHGFKMQVLGMWTRPWQTPLVLHLHDYVGTRPVMSRLMALRPPGPTSAIAISRSVLEDARRVLGSRMPIEVIHNGVDPDEWSPAGPRLDLDAASGLGAAPPHTVRIGLVATMARWKGHAVFLRALAMLPQDLPFRGYVIGGAIYQTAASQHSVDELRSICEQLGIRDRVGFTGFLQEPVTAFRALDIVVHASVRPEPFGRVIVEGMSTGTAVVARASGGAAELFESESEAVGCMTDNPGELANALGRLVRDADLRRKLGERGRLRVQRDFSRARMTANVAAVYERVLSSR